MYYALDRFEGDMAVLQDDNAAGRNVPRERLPENARPGDVYVEENGRFRPAPEEAERRRARIRDLKKQLFRKGTGANEDTPGGNVK